MHAPYSRLASEWRDLNITYPEWVSTVVMDEVYYITTMILVCATCFAVGLAMGFIVTLV